jgi:hypothetical protein
VSIFLAGVIGIEKMPKNEEYGEGVRFKFVVSGGIHNGKPTGNIGTVKPTANNSTGRLIKGLLGGDFKAGDKIDLKACIGKRYTLVVQPNKNNRNTSGS